MSKLRSAGGTAAAVALVLAWSLPGHAQAGTWTPRLPGWRLGPQGPAQSTRTPTGPAESGSGHSTIECRRRTSNAANVTLGCPGDLRPTRESTIAVDPTDPRHMIAAAIHGDYGDQTIQFSTTFDGG